MQNTLLKSLIIFTLISLSACGAERDPNLSKIEYLVLQMPGVTSVVSNGQYAQGGRGAGVCGLLITSSKATEAEVKRGSKALEQQYSTNYRLCVNTTSPD